MAIGAVNFGISIFMGCTISVSGCTAISIQCSVAVSDFRCINIIASNRDVTSMVSLRCRWNSLDIAKQAIVRVLWRTLCIRVLMRMEKGNRNKIIRKSCQSWIELVIFSFWWLINWFFKILLINWVQFAHIFCFFESHANRRNFKCLSYWLALLRTFEWIWHNEWACTFRISVKFLMQIE